MQAARVSNSRGGMTEAHLASYAKAAVSYPRLTREDEIQLAGEVTKGSEEAVHRLVLSNLYLVIRIARNYRRQNTSLLDLINEGNIGLLKAVGATTGGVLQERVERHARVRHGGRQVARKGVQPTLFPGRRRRSAGGAAWPHSPR